MAILHLALDNSGLSQHRRHSDPSRATEAITGESIDTSAKQRPSTTRFSSMLS